MPDDNLFDDDPKDPKDPAKDNDANDGPKDDPTGKVAALEAQLAELRAAQKAGDGNTAQLATAIKALSDQLAAAQAADTQDDEPQALDPKSLEAQRQAKFTKFYTDPEGFIAKQAAEVARSTFGPYLRLQAEQRRDEIIAAQQARIDELHGKGTWDKYFASELAKTFKDLPLEMQSSSSHVAKAVAAIYGDLSLNDSTREALEKARTEASKAKTTPPALMDGGRPAPKAGTLSEEEQAYLQSLARAGIELNAKDYLAAKSRGNTEDDWKPAKRAAR